MSATRAAVYLRVSTVDQTTENQSREVRAYIDARGWSAVEYCDEGISGAKERRPALDRLLADCRRRKVDVVCWRLDRLGRNLRHLVTLLDELSWLGVASFVGRGDRHRDTRSCVLIRSLQRRDRDTGHRADRVRAA